MSGPVLQNDLVDNFPADDAPPAAEFALFAVEVFVDHGAIASIAFHDVLLVEDRLLCLSDPLRVP